jgi:hypothetical protein
MRACNMWAQGMLRMAVRTSPLLIDLPHSSICVPTHPMSLEHTRMAAQVPLSPVLQGSTQRFQLCCSPTSQQGATKTNPGAAALPERQAPSVTYNTATTVAHLALGPKCASRLSYARPAAVPAVDAPSASSCWPSLPPRPFTLPRGRSCRNAAAGQVAVRS